MKCWPRVLLIVGRPLSSVSLRVHGELVARSLMGAEIALVISQRQAPRGTCPLVCDGLADGSLGGIPGATESVKLHSGRMDHVSHSSETPLDTWSHQPARDRIPRPRRVMVYVDMMLDNRVDIKLNVLTASRKESQEHVLASDDAIPF